MTMGQTKHIYNKADTLMYHSGDSLQLSPVGINEYRGVRIPQQGHDSPGMSTSGYEMTAALCPMSNLSGGVCVATTPQTLVEDRSHVLRPGLSLASKKSRCSTSAPTHQPSTKVPVLPGRLQISCVVQAGQKPQPESL
jgi:hypothetical protein